MTGIVMLVWLQLKVGISLSSNGRDRMAVDGTNQRIMQLKAAAT